MKIRTLSGALSSHSAHAIPPFCMKFITVSLIFKQRLKNYVTHAPSPSLVSDTAEISVMIYYSQGSQSLLTELHVYATSVTYIQCVCHMPSLLNETTCSGTSQT